MSKTEHDARDFTMARLAACRAALAAAAGCLDDALLLFITPSEDRKGSNRTELLEAIDSNICEAALAVQHAQVAWGDVDPSAEEPELEDEDDDSDPDDE